MREKPTHCYAGICPECGALCASRYDSGDKKEIAKDVAEFIADGLTIERVTLAEIGERFAACSCLPGTLL